MEEVEGLPLLDGADFGAGGVDDFLPKSCASRSSRSFGDVGDRYYIITLNNVFMLHFGNV